MHFWRHFQQKRLAMVGLLLLGLVVLLTLLAPILPIRPPNAQNWGARMQPPSWQEPFGTDPFGRSVLSRTLYGGRISLASGLLPVFFSATVGTLIGLASGYLGGRLDRFSMQVMDVLLSLPSIFLALALIGALGPGWWNAILAVSVASVPQYARLIRAQVMSLKEQEFITAAHAVGVPTPRILFRHILPNAVSVIVIQATLGIGFSILSMAGLSFLGLGVQPPTSDWGAMLSSGRRFLPDGYWLEIFPGLFILLVVLGANLVGDGLRDTLDPKNE